MAVEDDIEMYEKGAEYKHGNWEDAHIRTLFAAHDEVGLQVSIHETLNEARAAVRKYAAMNEGKGRWESFKYSNPPPGTACIVWDSIKKTAYLFDFDHDNSREWMLSRGYTHYWIGPVSYDTMGGPSEERSDGGQG